ncbi:MAG TPA: DNA repair protein RecO [Methylomirabilota bacterium]|jgi:DNA repair protein RecO (recombination protein O)|nr:DNA repair protein RecO [Methylomirabilota bacterium]
MQYKKLTGIILKKQNYAEADQILTLWTQEAGKIRVKARGIRLPKSKLVYSLQDLSLVSIEITGRSLPTLISASPQRQFSTVTQDLKKAAMGFYAAELMLKLTADEQPNTQVFELLVDFLKSLDNSSAPSGHEFIDNFAVGLSRLLGFGVPEKIDSHREVNSFIESLIERGLKSEAFLISI